MWMHSSINYYVDLDNSIPLRMPCLNYYSNFPKTFLCNALNGIFDFGRFIWTACRK